LADHATPNLPARDFIATAAFYAKLGFEEDYRSDGWMILSRGM
jgi:predicted lactoylglutathione lyase